MTRPHGAALSLMLCLSVSFYGFGGINCQTWALREPPRVMALARLAGNRIAYLFTE
ncbi:hypothetical protein PHIN109289_11010 [Phaeobacter inhibens]